MNGRIFQPGLPGLEWTKFAADGFSEPATGVVYRDDRPPCCGAPVGGESEAS
jgi:hypothetical protein